MSVCHYTPDQSLITSVATAALQILNFYFLPLTVVDCGGLVPPSNGNRTLTGTTFGSQANYSCFVGYTLDGAMLRTCTAAGSWSESDPMCNSEWCDECQ